MSFLTPADAELLEMMRFFVREAGRLYEPHVGRSLGARIHNPGEAFALLGPQMARLSQEEFRLLTMTTKNQIISSPTIYVGNVSSAIVRPAEVYRPAILDGAGSIMVAHNHPSGDPAPSPEDIQITRQLSEAGKLLGIELLDHLIIGSDRFVSMRERGLGF